MTVPVNGPSSANAENEDGFRKLGIRLESIEFYAKGAILGDRIKDLESAGVKLSTAPCPVSVPVGDVPNLGTVHLLDGDHKSGAYHFAVGGMRGKITAQCEGRWFLKIHGGGPHSLGEDWLAKLEDEAHMIKEFFLGEVGYVELSKCSVALYGIDMPAPSHPALRDYFCHIFEDGITRGKRTGPFERLPGSDEETFGVVFGSASGGRQLRVAVWDDGKHFGPPTNREAFFAWLGEDASYLQDGGIVCVELIFHRPFIGRIERGIRGNPRPGRGIGT